jgi:hypothetical protein
MSMTRISIVVLCAAACGGGGKPAADPAAAGAETASAGPQDEYAPLDIGADYATYTRVNKAPYESPTHGKRFVEVYVNQVGLAAYQSAAEFPTGTIVVKTSWETVDGKPTDVPGPIFVMEKRAKGFAPEHQDWWYGLHWEKVPASWVARMGGKDQVYWRSPSKKVDYCWGCHENYDRNMGLPPAAQRNWTSPVTE